MDIKQIITSKEFLAVEHSAKVAAYVGVAGFLATVVSELANNQAIANLVTKNPADAVLFMFLNMVLAGVVKYVNLHKTELEAEQPQVAVAQ